jgi:hypothetical protein
MSACGLFTFEQLMITCYCSNFCFYTVSLNDKTGDKRRAARFDVAPYASRGSMQFRNNFRIRPLQTGLSGTRSRNVATNRLSGCHRKRNRAGLFPDYCNASRAKGSCDRRCRACSLKNGMILKPLLLLEAERSEDHCLLLDLLSSRPSP